MTKMNTLIRLTALAAVAFTGVALSAHPAKAWGPWGSWAAAGTTASCSAPGGNAGSNLPCTGNALIGSNRKQLSATTPSGCGISTQAYGWPQVNGNYVQVIATDNSNSQYGATATTTAPINLTQSICRCQHIVC